MNNIVCKVHKLSINDSVAEVISSTRVEIDSNKEVKETDITPDFTVVDKFLINSELPGEIPCFKNHFHKLHSESNLTMKVIKIETNEHGVTKNYITKIEFPDETNENYVFTETNKKQEKRLTLPNSNLIICQNCDCSFPTKYQFQRHQCHFNAEKVVLKPEVVGQDFDKAIRIKYECDICNKTFVSHSNLERHTNYHRSNSDNVCEFCNKSFISENRLKIHKENHCKKAEETTTKFYRSDVMIWQCEKCQEVFANEKTGNKHIQSCSSNFKQPNNDNNEIKEDTSKNDNETNMKNGENSFDITFEQAISNQTDNMEQPKDTLSPALIQVVTEMLYQCEFCNRTFAAKISVLNHQQRHSTEKNYECIFCNKNFDDYTIAVTHWQNNCNDDSNFYLPKMLYCEHCDRTFKSHEILYNHKNKKKHFCPKIHNSEQENLKTEKTMFKLITDTIYKINELTNHNSNNDNNNQENIPPEHLNQVAEKDSTDDTVSSSTTATTTPTTTTTTTTTTTDATSTANNINDTAVSSTNDTAVSTNDVVVTQENEQKKRGRKRKWLKTEMMHHKYVVENGYRYQCERCATVFESISLLDTHKDATHISNYPCNECGQVVHSSKALMIHCRAHQSLKPYICDQCGRSYSQTSHLWQHMRFHQGIKPFACPHEGCDARYTIRPDLKDHIRKVHTRERPFKCAVCNKCFLTGSVYYQHRLIHTNDRRYGCDICSKRFFRADALNNHRRIHTDERPFPCPVCGREFRQKGDRNKHVRTQHPF